MCLACESPSFSKTFHFTLLLIFDHWSINFDRVSFISQDNPLFFISEKKTAVLVYFQKAFDVEYNVLVAKIKRIGVKGIEQDWFKTYFIGWEQLLEY